MAQRTMKNELIYGLSFAEYQAIPALNMSLLKEILDSPGRLDWRRRNPWTPSDAAILGNAIHTLLLEPGEFERRYVTAPVHQEDLPEHFVDVPPEYLGKRGAWLKDGRAWKALQEAAGKVLVKPGEWKGPATSANSTVYRAWKSWAKEQGLTVLSHGAMTQAKGAAQAVMEYEPAAELLAAGEHEVTLVWQDRPTGLWCKGRMDCYDADQWFIDTDIKSTGESVHHESIGRLALRKEWHLQRAYYKMGLEAIYQSRWRGLVENMEARLSQIPYIIAVEVDEPWRCEVGQLGLAEMELGMDKCRTMLNKYAGWQARGEWPLNTGVVVPIRFQDWAFKE